MEAEGPLKDTLSGLANIQGLVGAAVLSTSGGILASRMSGPYDPVLIVDMLTQVAGTADVLASVEPDAQLRGFWARFDSLVVLIRFSERYTVAALAASAVNPAVLSVALNAVQTRVDALVTQHARPEPEILKPYATVSTVANPGFGVAAAAQSGSQSGGSGVHSTTSGVRSGSQAKSMATNAVVAPDAVPTVTLKQVVALLAGHVGPMAQALLKREISNLGATTTTLPRSDYPALVEACARSVEDRGAREVFVRTALQALT